MALPQNFRNALNGFNREDVVNYISYMTNKHETQLNAVRSEAEELRRELAEREDALKELDDLREEIAKRLEEQGTLKTELEERKVELDLYREESEGKDARIAEQDQTIAAQKQELEAMKRELELARAAAAEPQRVEPSRWNEELNAYRRAESAERRARERVNQMYDQANGALAEASVRVERTAGQIAELVTKVESDLDLLRRAIGDSENTLADTAVMLGAIRPETD